MRKGFFCGDFKAPWSCWELLGCRPDWLSWKAHTGIGRFKFYHSYRCQRWPFTDSLCQGEKGWAHCSCQLQLPTEPVSTLWWCVGWHLAWLFLGVFQVLFYIIHKGDLKCPCKSRAFISSLSPTTPTTQVDCEALFFLEKQLHVGCIIKVLFLSLLWDVKCSFVPGSS